MLIEKNLIKSILKLTSRGDVLINSAAKDAKLSRGTSLPLIKQLKNRGLIIVTNKSIQVDLVMRVKLAIRAMELGSDIEDISNYLVWQEFEEIAAFGLTKNGFVTKKNVRFKYNSKRWEIDVIGCKKSIVVCIDCKQWHHRIGYAVSKKMVQKQINRVTAFAESLPNPTIDIECVNWEKAKFVPTILSLIPGDFKFIDDVPVVPVLQFQDFLLQLPAYISSLKHVDRAFNHL